MFLSKAESFSIFFFFLNIIIAALAVDPYSDDSGVTQINAMRISYSWTISNYGLNDKKFNQSLRSPIFSNDDNERRKWQLELYPKGSHDHYKKYVGIFLNLVSGPQVLAHFTFSTVNGYGKKIILNSQLDYMFKPPNISYGWRNAILQDDLKNETKFLLPEDRLIILVDIIINNGTTNLPGERCSALNKDSNIQPALTLFQDSLFSDVELHVNGQIFKVHRGIVAAHSPWFLKTFKAHSNKNIINILNIDTKLLYVALRYIYTGKIENLEHIAEDLLVLSIHLGIDQLQLACEIAMCKTITPKNAIKVLNFADLYDAKDLKQQAAKYIATHATHIVGSSDFKDLQKSKPHPLFDIFRILVERNGA